MKNVALPLLPLLPLLIVGLSGCTRSGGAYPSLAQRPAELRGFAEPAPPPPATLVADPALDAQVAAARKSLAEIIAGFDRDAAAARAAAGRATARTVGSDAWLDAQTALAGLDDWRARGSALATDADALASTRAAALQPAYPAVEALRGDASAEVARQDATIRDIAARLPGA